MVERKILFSNKIKMAFWNKYNNLKHITYFWIPTFENYDNRPDFYFPKLYFIIQNSNQKSNTIVKDAANMIILKSVNKVHICKWSREQKITFNLDGFNNSWEYIAYRNGT